MNDATAAMKKVLTALKSKEAKSLAKKITSLGLSRALRGIKGEGGTSRMRTNIADYIELQAEPKLREWAQQIEDNNVSGSSDIQPAPTSNETQTLRDEIEDLKDSLQIVRDEKCIMKERNTALEDLHATLRQENADLLRQNHQLREENEQLKERLRLFDKQEDLNPFGFDFEESSTANTKYHQFVAFRM